jgi:hypothetical protein
MSEIAKVEIDVLFEYVPRNDYAEAYAFIKPMHKFYNKALDVNTKKIMFWQGIFLSIAVRYFSEIVKLNLSKGNIALNVISIVVTALMGVTVFLLMSYSQFCEKLQKHDLGACTSEDTKEQNNWRNRICNIYFGNLIKVAKAKEAGKIDSKQMLKTLRIQFVKKLLMYVFVGVSVGLLITYFILTNWVVQ